MNCCARQIGYLLASPPDSVELERAKKQLQSMLFMNLEQRPVVFEDIARQILSIGKRQQADYYFNQISCVKVDDIMKIAQRIFFCNRVKSYTISSILLLEIVQKFHHFQT